MQNHNTQALFYNFDDSIDFLIISDSLTTYIRDIIFQTWQIIEIQLAKIELDIDPAIYSALNARATCLFEAWLAFRYTGDRGV